MRTSTSRAAKWLPDGKRFSYQMLQRDQKRLDLNVADVSSLTTKTLHHRNQRNLDQPQRRSALPQEKRRLRVGQRTQRLSSSVFVYIDGKLQHAISSGDWDIEDTLAVDEDAGLVYVNSNRDFVPDRQLYALRLDGSDATSPRRISQGDGVHGVTFGNSPKLYVDTYSESEHAAANIRARRDRKIPELDRREQARREASVLAVSRRAHRSGIRHDQIGRRTGFVLPRFQAGEFRSEQTLSRVQHVLRRSARTSRHARLDRLFQRVHGATRLCRVLTRQPRHGQSRPPIHRRHLQTVRQARSRRPARRHPLAETATVDRRQPHRHVRLELRRLHDVDAAGESVERTRRRRSGRAGHRLESLRHRATPNAISARRKTTRTVTNYPACCIGSTD